MIVAIEDFSNFPVYNLFNGKLDYLSHAKSTQSVENNLSALKAAEKQKMEQELLELDKEMSRLIGHELETRKLDRHQPQSSDVHLPYSKLVQHQTSVKGSSTSASAPGILLKKKKKSVIKSLSSAK